MGIDALVGAITGTMLMALAIVYIGLFLATLVFALRGDIPKAIICGSALLTMLSVQLGLIMVVAMLIVTAFTRNLQVLGYVVVGFLTAVVLSAVIAMVLIAVGVAVSV